MNWTNLPRQTLRMEIRVARQHRWCALEVTPEEPAVEIPSSIVFITPDGSWVREESPEYFDVLGDMNPDYDAPLYALQNLGFIGVCSSPRKCCIKVKLRPRNVTGTASLSI